MTRFRRLMRISLALAFFSIGQAAFAGNPGSYPWEVRRAQNAAAVAWTSEEIAAFLATVTAAEAPLAVGDFRFASLVGDGTLQLVASVDYSGRGFFNTVLVVRRTGTGYAVQKLPALNMGSLAGAIVDLDGDGRQELVLPTALTPYLGAAYPQAKWQAIYAWSGKLYVESTASYAAYYRASVVAPLRQRLVAASVTNDVVPLAVARIEHDKAVRVLPAANPDAGIATARSLAGDANPRLRILGAAVAADIGSADAAAILRMLATDPDRTVASYASAATDARRNDRCERADISVLSDGTLPAVDLASAAPVRVAITLDAQRRATQAPVTTVTFGEAGIEQSLVDCGPDGDSGRVVCRFNAGATGLHPGDGVATLIATRADGTCMRGQDAIEVVSR